MFFSVQFASRPVFMGKAWPAYNLLLSHIKRHCKKKRESFISDEKINLLSGPAFPLILVKTMLEKVGEIWRQYLRDEDVLDDLALGQRQSDDAETVDVDLFAAPDK
jgi:hypothetical protein